MVYKRIFLFLRKIPTKPTLNIKIALTININKNSPCNEGTSPSSISFKLNFWSCKILKLFPVATNGRSDKNILISNAVKKVRHFNFVSPTP